MLNSLHVAQSGLTASRTAVEGVMNNISNEHTPGYKKRIVEFSESSHIDGSVTGRGIQVEGVKRITNEYLYDNLIKEESKESYYMELSARLSDVESLFFETTESGFSNDLNRYFQAMEDLRSDPNNEIYKNNLKNQANIIVEDLKNLYQGIEDIQTVTKNTIKDDVDIINGILADIGTINEKIGQQIVPPNDLLDSRDALEKKLAEYVDITIDRTDEYELRIGGVIAVRYNTNIHNVSLVEEPIAQTDKINKSDFNAFTTFATGDSVTYRQNNSSEFTITYGDTINAVVVDTPEELMDALAYQINNTTVMSAGVTATVTGTSSAVLELESTSKGEAGSFESVFIFNDSSASTSSFIAKDADSSITAKDDAHIEIFDAAITLSSGKLKAGIENLTTESGKNKFSDYKAKLDQFVQTFVDMHDSFVTQSDGTYLYGEKAADLDSAGTTTAIGLFSGATVNTLVFNESAVVSLDQDKLDYLSKIQWKEDLAFDGSVQDGTAGDATSFSKFFQSTLVTIAADKENTDYLKDTQSAITNALEGSYDKLVKVDKDEEMINLIQFQSAYEANAKIITVVDEMLATLLGMIR